MPKRSKNAGEAKGLFLVPENGRFFCQCHFMFWESESKMDAHMEQSRCKLEAGAKAVQCSGCFRWFPNKAMLDAHHGKVKKKHTLPDATAYVDVEARVINDDGEEGLKLEPKRVLCLNTEAADLDDLTPQVALLKS